MKGGVPVLCVQKNKSEASEGTQAIGDWGVSEFSPHVLNA